MSSSLDKFAHDIDVMRDMNEHTIDILKAKGTGRTIGSTGVKGRSLTRARRQAQKSADGSIG